MDEFVICDGDAGGGSDAEDITEVGVGAGTLSFSDTGALTEVQTTFVLGQGPSSATGSLLSGHLHIAVEVFSGIEVLILSKISEES